MPMSTFQGKKRLETDSLLLLLALCCRVHLLSGGQLGHSEHLVVPLLARKESWALEVRGVKGQVALGRICCPFWKKQRTSRKRVTVGKESSLINTSKVDGF
jgi:hypothetical protein